MKINLKISLIIIFLSVAICGCDKGLELSPKDTISDNTFWKVPADFEKAANYFYNSLSSHSNGGLDANSDITVGAGSNTLSNGSYIAPQTSATWNNSYAMVRGTTRLIEKYDKNIDIQSETSRYAAEARFFRARAYFALVSTFGDVPLIKTVLDIDSPELYAPRTPRADIVTYIMGDLDWAVSKLPKESQLTANEKGRVTTGAVLALKARIALFEGTWAKFHSGTQGGGNYLQMCIDAANQLISSGEYGIYFDQKFGTANSYRNLFIEAGEGSPESILARRYNQKLDVSHNTTRWVLTAFNSPTKQLVDMYLCTDGLPISKSTLFQGYQQMASEFKDRDPRLAQTVFTPGTLFKNLGAVKAMIPKIGAGSNNVSKSGYQTYKFVSDLEESQLGTCYYDYMEFRYAEVLLNLAEALYEKSASISDTDLDRTINKLRDRVGMPHLTNTLVTQNGLNMRTEIRRERTIELAFEGFRYDDLRRWKESENALPVSLLGVKYVGTEFSTTPPNNKIQIGVDTNVDADGFVIADPKSGRTFSQKLYLMPIPLDQIQLNKNLTQNPDW